MKTFAELEVATFIHDSNVIRKSKCKGLVLASQKPHIAKEYRELLSKIAALSFGNSRYKLLFRGQSKDYRLALDGAVGGRSNLWPSILRPSSSRERESLLDQRFRKLEKAEMKLIELFPSIPEIQRMRIVRWAILQHYEICPTPLLDVTLSLQIALSFAIGSQHADEGFLYVFAVPLLNGPISVSTESMTQVIDLAQICPPDALRPHFQSGILLSDYPEYTGREQTHKGRGGIENDFGCRLLAKFHLVNISAWRDEGFQPTHPAILFPDAIDKWADALRTLKEVL